MKNIKLTQGKFALVDDSDYEFLNQWKWQFVSGYAIRKDVQDGKQISIFMHKVLLGHFGNSEGDHRDRNKLNNQKFNLRISTRLQNSRNKGTYRNNSLGIRGVQKTPLGKYVARIKSHSKERSLGTFATSQEAAIAYNIAAKKYFGEYACLNKV